MSWALATSNISRSSDGDDGDGDGGDGDVSGVLCGYSKQDMSNTHVQ